MSLGRPREFDRDAALDGAMRLFWRKGFGSTSLEDLLEVIGISKSSFYAAFKSKEDLFREALKHYCDLMAAELGKKLLQARSARLFIEDVLSIPLNEAQSDRADGCLIMNTAAEFGQRHAEFCQDVQQSLAIFERLFQQAVLRGQNEGDFNPSVDAVALGTYFSASLGGLRTMAKVGTPPERIRAAIPNILKAVE
jgi:TetR/AcrR family transcriptional repressor of nem operon